MSELKENQQLIDKSLITNNISQYEQRSDFVEVSELKEMLGYVDKVPVIKVRQLTLDELLKAQSEGLNQEKLLEGLIKALDNGSSDDIAKQLQDNYGIGGDKSSCVRTKLELKFCEFGIVEPILSASNLQRIAVLFPMVITRISDAIANLTNLGGVKKNLGN